MAILGRGMLLAIAATVGCSAPAQHATPEPAAPLHVQGPGYEGVILPSDAVRTGFMESEGTWVPTPDQVRAAESRLADYVRGEGKDRAPDLWQRLPSYHRQYLGTIHGGRRCVYVNLVLLECWKEMTEDTDGDRRLLEVDDGGEAFVQAEFDVAAGRYLWLGINGEA